jgi:mannose-6-phosphate isomerase-like protein (cupin superfamily)
MALARGFGNCQDEHLIWFVISGRMCIKMDDGHVEEFGPGDIGWISPGHIAWVVGSEPVVALNIDSGGIDKEKLT